jgi:hypothetical protein
VPPSMGPGSYVGILKICVFCSGSFYVKRQHGRRAKHLLAFSLTVIASEPFGVRRMKFGSAMEIYRATRQSTNRHGVVFRSQLQAWRLHETLRLCVL